MTATPLLFMNCIALAAMILCFPFAGAAAGNVTLPLVPGNDGELLVVEDALGQFKALKQSCQI